MTPQETDTSVRTSMPVKNLRMTSPSTTLPLLVLVGPEEKVSAVEPVPPTLPSSCCAGAPETQAEIDTVFVIVGSCELVEIGPRPGANVIAVSTVVAFVSRMAARSVHCAPLGSVVLAQTPSPGAESSRSEVLFTMNAGATTVAVGSLPCWFVNV